MPTRKQRKRALKERRHEYETVWVDDEGNELEEPPEDALPSAREKRSDKPKSQAKSQARGGRAGRTPPIPSWSRAAKRSVILGVVIFAVFMFLNSKSGSSNSRLATSLVIAVVYTALFIPFTFYVDRWTYRRWEKVQAAKKR
jgi:hypothetical protein